MLMTDLLKRNHLAVIFWNMEELLEHSGALPEKL
jgi:hypothetical protein